MALRDAIEESIANLIDAVYSRSSRYRGRNAIEERIDDLEDELADLMDELNDWEKDLGGRGRRF